MTLEETLEEISESGWTVSWAFQFSPGHWRVSLINSSEDSLKHCADAPTFLEALCNAYGSAIEALEPDSIEGSIDTSPELTLAQKLGLGRRPPEPIKRRSL